MSSVPTIYDLPDGWRLATFHTLDGTNAEMKRFVVDGRDHVEGLIMRSDEQTAGRGRLGRTWVSPRGNVYASFLIAAPEAAIAPQIGFVAVVSVIDALGQIAELPLRCKWPNDVLLNGKKVCGILPELVSDAAGQQWLVLGIGINLQPVNVAEAAYPVTSLADHGVAASADTVVRILAQDLAHRLRQWREEGFATISKAWMAAGPALDEVIAVRMPGAADTRRGRFRGLDEQGALVLEADGQTHRIFAGEVLFQSPPEARAGVA